MQIFLPSGSQSVISNGCLFNFLKFVYTTSRNLYQEFPITFNQVLGHVSGFHHQNTAWNDGENREIHFAGAAEYAAIINRISNVGVYLAVMANASGRYSFILALGY